MVVDDVDGWEHDAIGESIIMFNSLQPHLDSVG